ncbi:MAG: glycosyltransferase [archaeon]
MRKKSASPFVTVGVIAKNEEVHIAETLHCILDQDYPKSSFEIIFVNDRSTDNTFSTVEQLQKKSKRIRIIDTATHDAFGPCHARNCVIDASNKKAAYITFTDADCSVPKHWLSSLVSAIGQQPRTVACVGGPRLPHPADSKQAQIISDLLSSGSAQERAPFATDSIANCNALYRKDVLVKNRYDETLFNSDDNELNFRLRQQGLQLFFFPSVSIFHHEQASACAFFSHMLYYGRIMSKTMLKHKQSIRWYAPTLAVLMLFFFIAAIAALFNPLVRFFFFLLLLTYVLILFLVTAEEIIMHKDPEYVRCVFLIPIMHAGYGWGVLTGLLMNRHLLRKSI